ncbi:MAG TPA: ABC-type transport auxiliary lipoprotein family protein [Burkholderiales bacterium]|nr:ABC-type transport auxiliary lipoprotein family protein [Burkholderiales bacterium]
MSARRIVLAVCAALTLAACSIGKPIPQATTYVVEPPPLAAGTPAPRRPETLRMGNVRVAVTYAGHALVYRVDGVQYVSDPYHAFIAEPGAMLGERMAEWLDRAGPFKTVVQPGSARPAPYVLEATVAELYGDFRGGRPPAAVLSVQFALIDQAGARPKVVHERTIAARVDLPRASPDALVDGYGKALAEILSQLVPELGAAGL